jgi:6-phosphofructokinase
MGSTFGILVGGGPAPGINSVIASATHYALRQGHKVVGIRNGFENLMEGDLSCVRVLDAEVIQGIHRVGGSLLHTSRANPTRNPKHLKAVVESLQTIGVDYLITIGGDDTAFSAKGVEEAAEGKLKVIHVPKTIDNDLPLPNNLPTFGFETARNNASLVLENLMNDAYTRANWFFVVLMGRNSGHLALGSGKSAGSTITLIAEEFPEGTIHLEDVARILEGAVIKRLSQGQRHGIAVLAEGIGERLDSAELSILDSIPRDEHGHIRLADVPLGRVLARMVQDSLAERGIDVRIGTKDVGYELRCAPPVAFDRDYTHDLGVGAVRLLLNDVSGVMVTRQHGGKIVPMTFDEMIDPETGRTAVRMVDMDSDSYYAARALMTRIENRDLEETDRCERLAKAARLTPGEVEARYKPL